MNMNINFTRLKKRLFIKVENTFCTITKPQQKFLQKMTFGILKSNTLMLTDIARTLKSKTMLKQTVKSLDKMLNSANFQEIVLENHLQHSSPFQENEIIAIDHTDICKPYAKNIENMRKVRDGSSQDGKSVNGFKLVTVTRNCMETRTPELVNMQVLDVDEKAEINETKATIDILKQIEEKLGTAGVRVLDRGFDAESYYEYFLDTETMFVIRGKVNRSAEVIKGGVISKPSKKVITIAKNTTCKTTIERWVKSTSTPGGKRLAELHIGAKELFVSGSMTLNMIVIKDSHKKQPMILYTNQNIDITDANDLIKISDQYLKRWECEEVIRYIKQEYSLEDIRYRKAQNFNSIIAIMVFADSFLSRDIGCLPKLGIMKQKLLSAAQALNDDVVFCLYRLKHGFQRALEGVTFDIRQQIQENLFVHPSFDF